jgi:curved DNA-binding protein CbpA
MGSQGCASHEAGGGLWTRKEKATAVLCPAPSRRRKLGAYSVLGVDVNASTSEIHKAYRRLCLVYHPDKNVKASPQARSAATKKFLELGKAFDTLSDAKARAEYDSRQNLCRPSEGTSTLRVRVFRQRQTAVEKRVSGAIDVARKRLKMAKVKKCKATEKKKPVRTVKAKRSTSSASKVIPPGKKWIVFERRKHERKRDKRLTKFVAFSEDEAYSD